jgi:hypothetical protein
VTVRARLAVVGAALAIAVVAVVAIDGRAGRVALAVALVVLGAGVVWLGRDR